jgi:imidazolonepropionase-like amidohydrolase
MKRSVIFALFFCITAALTASSSAASDSREQVKQVWITDVFIVSPENLGHIAKGNVLIENGRIARIERRQPTIPSGAIVISGAGQYLIPGLIDSHVHLANIPGMSFDQSQSKPEMVREYFQQLPRSYLYFGYTTLVDLAVFRPQVLQDFRNAPLHPDLYDCGGSLPLANGYPMNFLSPETRFQPFPNFIYDRRQAGRIPAQYRPEDHTPTADVARVKTSGAICVKTYFERGFADDKNLPVLAPEMFAEVRKAATQDGLVLMIHANAFEAQQFAVNGNADVIAHGMWHWGSLDPQPDVPEEIKHLLDRIVEEKIGYQPTLQVLSGEMAYFDPDYLKQGALAKVAPKSLLDWFRSDDGNWFGRELNEDHESDAAFIAAYEKGPMRRVRQVTAYLAANDANFVFGTDTPSSPTYGNLPGLNGYLEMKQLQKAGLSLSQIFSAATINNAREFKMESEIGTIEPGKIANLILMKKSPLESVDAYDSITMVFIHGKAIPREKLAADSN